MANKKSSLGCLFWLALILLVIVIVLANLKTAGEIIKKTGFEDIISEFLEKKENPVNPNPTNRPREDKEEPAPSSQPDIVIKNNETDEDTTTKKVDEQKPLPTEIPAQTTEKKKEFLRKALIYFVKVDENGDILLKGFERAVYYNDSPLKDTLETLLRGPVSYEINMEYYSMIPENTRLTNIYVKGSTAYLDFTENFRINPMGHEGLQAQLNQIVYTATEFANVSNVQILIDGKKVNYLGPEGIFIGEPLSRTSLIAGKNHS
ncbi:MAG: GerMN domain-containing protein [Spirochaetales bacterium]|nr:GerMN domain-containing protein [Spirochaetales bacterium]